MLRLLPLDSLLFLSPVCPRLLHVVTRDGDGVELGHVLGRVRHDVAHDAHRGLGRVDVGVAHHVLLQDVVLDGSGHFLERHAWVEALCEARSRQTSDYNSPSMGNIKTGWKTGMQAGKQASRWAGGQADTEKG